MMARRGNWGFLLAALAGFCVFVVLTLARGPLQTTSLPDVADRVVISAPVQVLLAGGDPFLAAAFEAIRSMATVDDSAETHVANTSFQIRVHRVVAQLNPCHEDNYYVANAMLSWGGAPEEAQEVLRRAIDCRHWDEFPPFFYGINQWFFSRNGMEARRALEIAADRSKDPANAAAMRRTGIMIEANSYPDERAALAFLQQERARTSDPRLHEMLEKREQRLDGLITLREAQARFEAVTGRRLLDPRALLETGFLSDFPHDPLGLGYEFNNGHFKLRELEIPGFVRRR